MTNNVDISADHVLVLAVAATADRKEACASAAQHEVRRMNEKQGAYFHLVLCVN